MPFPDNIQTVQEVGTRPMSIKTIKSEILFIRSLQRNYKGHKLCVENGRCTLLVLTDVGKLCHICEETIKKQK